MTSEHQPSPPKVITDVELPHVVMTYLSLVASGRCSEIASLFTADAVVLPAPPATNELRGRDAIARFYTTHVARMEPEIRCEACVNDGTYCAVEISSRIPSTGEHGHVLDLFSLSEDGRISRMAAFSR